MARKKVVEQDSNPKKVCSECKKEKRLKEFYKATGVHFPDGVLSICNKCTNEQVDVNDINSVIAFLRSIDKPFFEAEWNSSLNSGKPPLGEYIRKANSLPMFRNKTFDNSDGMSSVGSIDVSKFTIETDIIKTENGHTIKFSESLASKWGSGYKKHEILQMEKFYQDMKFTHEIFTPIHLDILMQLSHMSVQRDRLRMAEDWTNYSKISKTMEEMTKSAGFRPVDRQGIDSATGIKSFAQIFEEVEKRGFRKPPKTTFDEDIVDKMIVSLLNYYNRLVGSKILEEVPEEVKQEYDDFYEFNDIPDDINNDDFEDYENDIEEEEIE